MEPILRFFFVPALGYLVIKFLGAIFGGEVY